MTLLAALRAGLLLVPLLPLVHAGWPPALSWLLPDLYFPAVTARSLVFRGLVQLLVAGWLLLAVRHAELRPRRSPAWIALAAFLVAVTIADATGADPKLSLLGNYERMEGLLGLLHLAAWFAVASALLDQAGWRRLLAVSLGVASAVALCALAQTAAVLLDAPVPEALATTHQARLGFRSGESGFRADACLGSSVYLAVYLMVHVFLALLAARHARGPRRALLLGLAVLLAAALFWTKTRMALAGLALGLATAAVLAADARRRRAWLAAGAVLLVAAVLVLLLAPAWFADIPGLHRFASSQVALQDRAAVWRIALAGLIERPLGWGQENFALLFDAHHDAGLSAGRGWYDRAHNVFLGWFVAAGWPGGLAYLALWAVPFTYLFRGAAAPPRTDRALLAGVLVSYAAVGLTQLEHLTGSLVFFGVLAYLESRRRATAAPPPRPPASRAAVRGAAVAAVLVAAAGWLYVTVPGWLGARALATVVQQRLRLDSVRSQRVFVRPRPALDARLLADVQRALADSVYWHGEAREEAAQLAIAAQGAPFLDDNTRAAAAVLATRELDAELARQRTPSARTLALTAQLQVALGDAERARALFARAREAAPGKPAVVRGWAVTSAQLGDGEAALATLRALFDANPADRETARVLLFVAATAGRFDVVEDVLASLTARRRLPDATMVETLRAAGRTDLLQAAHDRIADLGAEIVADARGALPVGPDLASLYATAALRAGRPQQAAPFLRRFGEVASANPRYGLPRPLTEALEAGRHWPWLVALYQPFVRRAEQLLDAGRLPPSIAVRHFRGLADAHAAAGERLAAIAVLQSGARRIPGFAEEAARRIAQLR